MEIRNPRYNALGNIDVELHHPIFGWIPCSTSPLDADTVAYYNQAKTMTIAPYVAPVAPVPTSVSARQFRVQLRRAGLLDMVTAWVAQQAPEVQDSFEYSSSFLRDEPMMDAGFQALGFTAQEIDNFFKLAYQI